MSNQDFAENGRFFGGGGGGLDVQAKLYLKVFKVVWINHKWENLNAALTAQTQWEFPKT